MNCILFVPSKCFGNAVEIKSCDEKTDFRIRFPNPTGLQEHFWGYRAEIHHPPPHFKIIQRGGRENIITVIIEKSMNNRSKRHLLCEVFLQSRQFGAASVRLGTGTLESRLRVQTQSPLSVHIPLQPLSLRTITGQS